LALVGTASMLIAPAVAQGNNNPNKLHGAPVYVLNLLGKKTDWQGQGSYDNPDRHTIFVPEDTAAWGSSAGTYGNLTTDGTVLLWMTSGPEFAVLDGNAYDDGNASLQIANGRYAVYVVALAKPGRSSTLTGWYYDDEGSACFRLGEVQKIKRVKGQPQWVNTTDLFYIDWDLLLALGYDAETLTGYFGEEQIGQALWIFDYLAFLDALYSDADYYFWQLNSQGNKHLQLRFYSTKGK
jgi:hypothetical protein